MGVMNCNRKDCDNILCDRYADDLGYICNSCYNEMIEDQKYNPKFTIDGFMKNSKFLPDSEVDLDSLFSYRH
jgi:hypothetical protein